MKKNPEVVHVEDYSRALDEIYALRAALAYEAVIMEAHLDYKTFPISRRRIMGEQIARMRESARGLSQRAYSPERRQHFPDSLERAGANETLTRWQWEQTK